jgi:hypothetical protein
MPENSVTPDKSQLDKFKELARELEADEDEAHWDERLKKITKREKAPQSDDTSAK